MINKKIASIKLNAIGNYFGQSYTILVTLLCTPLYIKYLGAESHGLVGFFIILQNWLTWVYMGLVRHYVDKFLLQEANQMDLRDLNTY